MEGATLFRMISLIPDRAARSQSGSLFDPRNFERAGLLAPFLGWLGPLNPISKEEQQLLGLRAGGGKSPLESEGEEAGDAADLAEFGEESEVREESEVCNPGAGTQIAA
ncbi:MAG TPA: hypothetical protein VFB93_08600 [Burkholderiales bacterium]|nr:hypothetical protein [Burkholderiales bacterium]